jgi:hypothetical protein
MDKISSADSVVDVVLEAASIQINFQKQSGAVKCTTHPYSIYEPYCLHYVLSKSQATTMLRVYYNPAFTSLGSSA